MLDVHAPERGIGGFRDFAIHLLTITIGLLIALALENAAEALHHRHDRKEAEALIRQEIASNRDDIKQGEAQFKTEMDGMNRVMQTLEAMSQGQPGKLQESDFLFHQAPIQDSAWRTASTTGVVNYMPYEEVQRFSDAYKEQDQLEAIEKQTLDDYLQLIPVLSHHEGKYTPELAKQALPLAQHVVAHLYGMYYIGEGTVGSYDTALK
jgi:hypothetical protein